MDNLIESQNQAKRYYEPLDVSMSLACITPGAPQRGLFGGSPSDTSLCQGWFLGQSHK